MKKILFRQFCSLPQRVGVTTRTVLSESAVLKEAAIVSGEAPEVVSKLSYGLPLKEDLKAGTISNTIRTQWSNVPLQVRSVIEQSQSTSTFSDFANQETGDSMLVHRAKGLLALIGKGPADLQLHRKEYVDALSLVEYRKGMKSAYHWSRQLIPRTVAARCRGDLRVDPVDADRSVLLLDQLMGKMSIVLCFSGNELSGLDTGIKAWKTALGDVAKVHVIHFCEGWLSRRTHPLTRQILKSFKTEEKTNDMFIYRGKWTRDLVLDFHLYNKALPSILLMDQKGYVRWHAVGLPTEESVATLLPLIKKLGREKQ